MISEDKFLKKLLDELDFFKESDAYVEENDDGLVIDGILEDIRKRRRALALELAEPL